MGEDISRVLPIKDSSCIHPKKHYSKPTYLWMQASLMVKELNLERIQTLSNPEPVTSLKLQTALFFGSQKCNQQLPQVPWKPNTLHCQWHFVLSFPTLTFSKK